MVLVLEENWLPWVKKRRELQDVIISMQADLDYVHSTSIKMR